VSTGAFVSVQYACETFLRLAGLMTTFGELEAVLAAIHGIADSKRTAFQARLKNLHRLGLPIDLKTEKGKAATYSAGQVVEMALATELTELGLPPERVVRVLTLNWYPSAMAISIAARSLLERPHGFHEQEDEMEPPLSMFLFFDPAALAPLTLDHGQVIAPDTDQAADTFFYGGEGIVRQNLVRWTSGSTNRLSIVNVTALIDKLFGLPSPKNFEGEMEQKKRTLSELERWASNRSEGGFFTTGGFSEWFLLRYIRNNFSQPKDDHERRRISSHIEGHFGCELPIIEKVLSFFQSEKDEAAS
jgi:hypothetical protein